jgi:hypothetical protein
MDFPEDQGAGARGQSPAGIWGRSRLQDASSAVWSARSSACSWPCMFAPLSQGNTVGDGCCFAISHLWAVQHTAWPTCPALAHDQPTHHAHRSRNARLSPEARQACLAIPRAIQWAEAAVAGAALPGQGQELGGLSDPQAVADEVARQIAEAGGKVDYVEVRRNETAYPSFIWLTCSGAILSHKCS